MRVLQIPLNRRGEWVRATEDAPRGPFRILERLHGLEAYAAEAQSRLVQRFKDATGLTFDVERRLQRTYAIRRGPAVFVQAVLLVRLREAEACDADDNASLRVLKIATEKGSPTTWREAEVQNNVSNAVSNLVPRVYAWHALDRQSHQTTFGMLMEYLPGYQQMDSLDALRPMHLIRTADAVAKLHAAGYRHGDLCLWNVLWNEAEESVRLIDFTVGRPCDACDDDLIIVEEENLDELSRGTPMTPDEAWADAAAMMGPDRARMYASDANVEPVPGLGFGIGID